MYMVREWRRWQHVGVWLENLAKSIHRNFYALAALLVLTVVTLVAVDRQIQWIEGVIPFERIGKLGESIGKAAFLLGLVAVLYYGVRESYVVLRKKQGVLPAGLDAMLKYWISFLRWVHPLVGVMVGSVLLLHGYVMWWIWAGGNIGSAVQTGLIAAGVMIVVAVSGLFIRLMPKQTKLRIFHRLMAILFVLSFVVHRIVAD